MIQPFLNDSRVVSFKKSDFFPYARGLAVVSIAALTISAISLTLFAAGSLLLSLSKASFTIAKGSLIAAAAVAAGYFLKGYLDAFYTLVQAKIESTIHNRHLSKIA